MSASPSPVSRVVNAAPALAGAVAVRLAGATLTVRHAETELIEAPLSTATTAAALGTAASLGRTLAVAAEDVTPSLLLGNSLLGDDGVGMNAADPQAVAAGLRAVAAGAFSEVPVMTRTAGEALAFMLASPPTFHIARMGSPLALVADSMAAFAEESASMPMAMLDAPPAPVSGTSRPQSGARRAWSITAAVAAVDVVALTYLYQQNAKSKRHRRRGSVVRV